MSGLSRASETLLPAVCCDPTASIVGTSPYFEPAWSLLRFARARPSPPSPPLGLSWEDRLRLQRRRFSEPSDVRTLPRGRIDVVELDDTVVGRMTYEPGWRWSVDVQPIAGTATCQYHHLGLTISGRLRVEMADGWARSSSPTSSIRRGWRRNWAPGAGVTSSASTTVKRRWPSIGIGVGWSKLRAMACSLDSMAQSAQFEARLPSAMPRRCSVFRSAQASTPAS